MLESGNPPKNSLVLICTKTTKMSSLINPFYILQIVKRIGMTVEQYKVLPGIEPGLLESSESSESNVWSVN
jgi:hypothetical protein